MTTKTESFDVRTHNGCVTIQNLNTGNHRTFKIKTQKDDSIFMPGKRVVSLLRDGSCREDYRSWTPFAFVNDDHGVTVWRSKRGEVKLSDFEIYADMLNRIEVYEARDCEYLIESTCRICNRQLTEPESIRTGIGPVCAGR